ncbi:hypothetical protein [Clostridium thermobutyricum]|uniref:hypothetical protein n=1 Tax=Clostridium thermobutyricum TaxID=29372 RepID=UPI0018ABD568|nr:hypothetical protein [Clostridium thermobutyricum]
MINDTKITDSIIKYEDDELVEPIIKYEDDELVEPIVKYEYDEFQEKLNEFRQQGYNNFIIDDVFNPCKFTGYTAHYGWQGSNEFGYIAGYKNAADILIEQFTPDLNLMPIMFNYRHYIELILKNICYCHMDDGEYNNFIRKKGHNLKQIWNRSKKFLVQILKEEDLFDIETIINIFNLLDRDSLAFRYEFTKKSKPSITPGRFTINLFALKRDIDYIDKLLYTTYAT